MSPPSWIPDPSLAPQGRERIEWARSHMPVLGLVRREFEREKPLLGVRISSCLHVTKETAVLVETLRAGGAEVALCASNPLSTQDDVAAALAERGVRVFAKRGVTEREYYEALDRALDLHPEITMDDGGDLVTRLHTVRQDLLEGVLGGTEETTTGVQRFRAMEREGALCYPIVAVNDALTKHLFDNRYGTGQSTIDGILRSTGVLLAGKRFVVAGYGWVGKGIATRARGMGALVTVTEVDPIRALEATMDGFDVRPMVEAASNADLVVTATGGKWVVDEEAILALKEGAILANSGHFDNEVRIEALRKLSKSSRRIRPNVEAFELRNGRTVYLLAEGRLVNLAAAEGHPPEVMDMSFANQALSVRYIRENGRSLPRGVHSVPREIDERVARLKLEALGIRIDRLTAEQERYVREWREGT